MPLDATNYSPEPRDIGAERLRILADFLDTVPPERFKLERWADGDFAVDDCGTAACACGWATTITEFKVAGLHFRPPEPMMRGKVLAFGDLCHFEAVTAFFDVTAVQAWKLFHKSHYPPDKATPSAVAARIRAHLAARVECAS